VTPRRTTSPNIGEARIARDHNIDRKEIALPVAPRSIFVAAAPAGARHRFGGPGSNGLAEGPAAGRRRAGFLGIFGIVANLGGKRIPLFPKML
jgi:hypothetical protein